MSYITPNDMLCPSRLKAVNYCSMRELKVMDAAELQDIREEEDRLATNILFPINIINMATSVVLISLIVTTIADVVFRSIFLTGNLSINRILINLPSKKLAKYFLGVAIVQSIFFTAWKILFRDLNMNKGSCYFHNKRISRLRDKIAYLDTLSPTNPCVLKEKERRNLKIHFETVLGRYS